MKFQFPKQTLGRQPRGDSVPPPPPFPCPGGGRFRKSSVLALPPVASLCGHSMYSLCRFSWLSINNIKRTKPKWENILYTNKFPTYLLNHYRCAIRMESMAFTKTSFQIYSSIIYMICIYPNFNLHFANIYKTRSYLLYFFNIIPQNSWFTCLNNYTAFIIPGA